MEIKKAGCIVVDVKNKKVALIYRKNKKDFSFPKGHLEIGETLQECALRETEEETGLVCKIVLEKELDILIYNDSLRSKCKTYMYLATYEGISKKIFAPELVEELVWKDIQDVEDILSYQNLKDLWIKTKETVNQLVKN
jgi:8-oxo-dGTP diphosphatase